MRDVSTRVSLSSFQPSRPDPTPDEVFFYEPIYIQVSTTLFCVPKVHLDIPGTVLSRVLNTPGAFPISSESNVESGTHSSNPIFLASVSLNSFRSFLKGAWRRDDVPILLDDWMNILSIAHQWGFHQLKKEAKTSIETNHTLDLNWQRHPYHFIDLGRKYNIKEWVIKGYVVLVNPTHSLGGDTLTNHGLGQQAMKLFMVREALQQSLDGKYYACFSCDTTPDFEYACSTRSNSHHGKRTSRASASVVNVQYCDCGETVFAHRSARNISWQTVARSLIEDVFQHELKAVDYAD